jgi:hypothetical protein
MSGPATDSFAELRADLDRLRVVVAADRRAEDAAFEDAELATEPAPPSLFRSARDIATVTSDTPDWLLHGYVAAGAITELSGKVKAAGKTTLVTNMCRAMLDGKPFLGRATSKTAVVYCTEQSAPTFLQSLRRADLLDRDDLRVLFWHDASTLDWPDIVRAARAEAKRAGARLLIIDTLPQFAGVKGDAENNTGAALEAMRPLLEAAAADGLAIIVLRHDRKGGGEVGDSARGSSAFSGAVDVVLQLRRQEGQGRPGVRVINALSRYDETPETLVIELTEDGYVAHGDAEAVATQEAQAALLLTAPTSEADAMKEPDLLAAANVKRTVGQGVIREYLESGLLIRVGGGKRGDPFRYYRSAEERPKDSAGTGVVPAKSNGHGLNALELLSAALKGDVAAERNGDARIGFGPKENVRLLSAATSFLGAAESNADSGEPVVIEAKRLAALPADELTRYRVDNPGSPALKLFDAVRDAGFPR